MEKAWQLSEIREMDWLAPLTREALRRASAEARSLHSQQIYPEHLLLGLLDLESTSLVPLFQANNLSAAQVRRRVQARFQVPAEPEVADAGELTFSPEARECVRRTVMALLVEEIAPGTSRKVSPELLALGLFAHPRVQHILASAATRAVHVHTRLVEQIGINVFQQMERRFLFELSPAQQERVSFQYVGNGEQRRIVKSIEPPQYHFRDLSGLGTVPHEILSLVALLKNTRRLEQPARARLLIDPSNAHIKQFVRAIAGEAGVPLTTVFCAALAEIWQEHDSERQGHFLLRELFLALRLSSSSLIYLEDVDALSRLDEEQSQVSAAESQEETAPFLFWPAFLAEMDKLLSRPGIVLLAAVRKPEMLVPALLSEGRLGRSLRLELPETLQINLPRPVRPEKQSDPPPASELSCPSCHQPTQKHWQHCVYCGTALSRTCAHCGAPAPGITGARFCFQCGEALT